VGRVRERFNKWVRRAAEPPAPQSPLLFTDHEEIQDIARQMARTKVEIDRSILTLRSWARDLSRRVAEGGGGLEPGHDLRSLGETVGGSRTTSTIRWPPSSPIPSSSSATRPRTPRPIVGS
jgi:hypothetical protein